MEANQEATELQRLHAEMLTPPKKKYAHLNDHPDIKSIFSMWDNTVYVNVNAGPKARRMRVVK
jgi:hypothetical protein